MFSGESLSRNTSIVLWHHPLIMRGTREVSRLERKQIGAFHLMLSTGHILTEEAECEHHLNGVSLSPHLLQVHAHMRRRALGQEVES